MGKLDIVKDLGMRQNVTINVIDEKSGEIVQSHSGHNMATNSMLVGIARYLIGDGVLSQGDILSEYIPRYISLGTMGLKSLNAGSDGLPQIDYNTYIDQYPGYGADGYDGNKNNNRNAFGLGQPFTNYSMLRTYKVGDLINYKGVTYRCNTDIDVTGVEFDKSKWTKVADLMTSNPHKGVELIHSIRSPITFRDIEAELYSELPYTVDAVFSGMISTGQLATFRGNRDYIFITEAGLWGKRTWSDSGTNGLLAGYRLMPKNIEDHTNVTKIKQSILRVGINQVVQIIWKIQIGSMSDLTRDSRIEQLRQELAGKLDTDTVTVRWLREFLNFKDQLGG